MTAVRPFPLEDYLIVGWVFTHVLEQKSAQADHIRAGTVGIEPEPILELDRRLEFGAGRMAVFDCNDITPRGPEPTRHGDLARD